MADKLSPEQVLEAVSQWSLMEVNDFVKMFEEKFDVSAAAPVAVAAAAPGAAAGGEAVEEQTAFAVIIKSVDAAKKIKVIKEVRVIKPDLGLKEAKELVDSAPKEVIADVEKEDAEKYKKQLEEAGAEIELK